MSLYTREFKSNFNKADVDEWTATRQHFQEFQTYTREPHKSKRWYDFWKEERRRCREGYNIGRDYITGYHYFYLNYSPMLKTEVVKENLIGQNKAERIKDFPDFWDGDYDFFHYIESAENCGEHAMLLGSRGKGKSLKTGSMLVRNYEHFPDSKNYAFAYSEGFLTDDGIISKAWSVMDHISNTTPWAKSRDEEDSGLHRKASKRVQQGGVWTTHPKSYNSEIIGVVVGDRIDKVRGKRGKLMIWEEIGMFKKSHRAWNMNRPSMEDGKNTFGLMLAIGTGGCVCAGTKVWTNNGTLKNVEELVKEDGIIGYNGNTYSKEPIIWMQPPTNKQCYKLTTNTGRILECSEDHPILYLKEQKPHSKITKITEFKETKDFNIGDKIAILDKFDHFDNKTIWNPRVVGWLIGDGTYGGNQTVRIANCEPEINEYLEKNFDTKTNVEYTTKLGKTYKELRLKGVSKELRKIGIFGQTKLNKTLPKNIHSCSKETICEILGGLFDTDGYISKRINKTRKTTLIEISIAQASSKLIFEIQLLLQKLGIHGIMRERLPRENNKLDKNSWFEFTICDGESLLNFYNNIKLFPKEKQERLNCVPEIYKNKKRRVKIEAGIRFETITKIEDIGIKPIYNLEAGVTHTYLANGIVTHNTEGSNFEGAEEMFRGPKAYKIHAVTNRWEEGKENSEIAYFWPAYINYGGCYNKETGVSNVAQAFKELETDRNTVSDATDPTALTRRKAELPITPSEVLMRISHSIFPREELTSQEVDIENNPYRYADADFVGEFELDRDGQKYKFVNKNKKPIYEFPHSSNKNMFGAIVLFEHPKTDKNGDVIYNRYFAGCDAYDHDESTTKSLGSIFIGDSWTRRVVAEYTGRPKTAEEFYEICRRLLLYYNARANAENANKGIFTYFKQKNCEYLMADEPSIVRETLSDVTLRKTTGRRKVGTTPSVPVQQYGRGLIAKWLLESTNNPDKPEEIQCHKFRSLAAIKEMLHWNDEGNFDRIDALTMLMLIWEDAKVHAEKRLENVKSLSTDPYFMKFFNKNQLPKWQAIPKSN